MTQIAALTAATLPRSTGRRSWRLEFYDPKGQILLGTYTPQNPGGIVTGFVNRRYGNGTCGQLDFEAKPKLMPHARARNVVRLYYDTGEKVIPVHYGVLTKVPDANGGHRGSYESWSGKKLLENSLVAKDDLTFARTPVDAANWMNYFVGKYKHSALKFDLSYARIPQTGALVGSVDARGENLYDVLSALIKAVPNLGDNDWGVDPEGFVVVRPATGERTFSIDEVMEQVVTGDVYAHDTCTQATIQIANAVSDGAIVSAGYVPSLVTYTHTDPENAHYEAPRNFEMPKRKDGTPILEVAEYGGVATSGSAPSWLSSVTGTNTDSHLVAADGNSDTYVYPSSTANNSYRYFVFSSGAKTVNWLGGVLIIDAPAGTYDLQLEVAYGTATSGDSYTVQASALWDLAVIKGVGKVEVRKTAPPPANLDVNYAHTRLIVKNTVPTNLKVYEIRPLRVNTALVSQVAKSNIKLPAPEVTQLTLARAFASGGGAKSGYLLEECVGSVRVTGGRKELAGKVAEIIDEYTTKTPLTSRISLGDTIRPDARPLQTAIERMLAERRNA